MTDHNEETQAILGLWSRAKTIADEARIPMEGVIENLEGR